MRRRLLVLVLLTVVVATPSCAMIAPNTTKVMEPVATPLALAVAYPLALLQKLLLFHGLSLSSGLEFCPRAVTTDP